MIVRWWEVGESSRRSSSDGERLIVRGVVGDWDWDCCWGS